MAGKEREESGPNAHTALEQRDTLAAGAMAGEFAPFIRTRADDLAVAGSRCLLADPGRLDAVEGWIGRQHLWSRRAALVFTLPWTKEARDPRRMLAWAAELAGDPEWFIQKAIGWWLRELSKRDPARVRGFLGKHGAVLRSVARREASKYL